MAKPAPKPESTSHLITLANGAIYDKSRHRIVANPGGGTKAFTSESAGAAVELRMTQKREALTRAANAVAMQGGGVDGRELHGDMAFVEAIGEAMTMKALTVNDPKAVDAARFLFSEIGISEQRGTGGVDDTDIAREILNNIADIARAATIQNDRDTVIRNDVTIDQE